MIITECNDNTQDIFIPFSPFEWQPSYGLKASSISRGLSYCRELLSQSPTMYTDEASSVVLDFNRTVDCALDTSSSSAKDQPREPSPCPDNK